jgi:hypothetical protein
MQSNGGQLDPRVLASLEHARDIPPEGRYVMVDTAGARLHDRGWTHRRFHEGHRRQVRSIDPDTDAREHNLLRDAQSILACVGGKWFRSTIAPNVLGMGLGYIKSRGLPGDVIGTARCSTRRRSIGRRWRGTRHRKCPPASRPGQFNGAHQDRFPNSSDIYLHDTPNKDLFAQDDRSLSHGCIRLEDAERLGRWLMGREPQAASSDPEQNVLLPKPVRFTSLT